jgi:histidine triad (HIT) family protein
MNVACVFCELIREDSATWVAVENQAVAFKPLPEDILAPGHTLVIPRSHREGLFGTTQSELAAVMDLVQRVAASMRTELGSTGTFLLQASGPDSGGTVAHLHFHVVPCWADDQASYWPEARSAHVVDGDPYAAIRAAFGG